MVHTQTSNIKRLFKRNTKETSLEAKLFSILNLFAFLTCVLANTINVFSNTYLPFTVLMGVAALLFLWFAYLAYFRNLMKVLFFPFLLVALSGLILSWFYYNGFGGATPFFILATMSVFIYSNSTKFYGLPFYIFYTVCALLVLIQWTHPEWIQPYSSDQNQNVDVSMAFLIALFLLGFSNLVFKKEFDVFKDRIVKRNEALENAQKRFLDIASLSGEWIWEVDIKTRFTYSSENVADLMGYEPEEMAQFTFYDLVTSEKHPLFKVLHQDMISDPKPLKNYENWFVRQDGKDICLQTNVTPMMNADGKLIGFRGVSVDITHEIEQKEQDYWKQYFLDALMDNIPDAIYFKDINSRFLRINKALAAEFDLDNPSAAIGKTDADFFDMEHAKETALDERAIINSGKPIIAKEELEVFADRPPNWVSSTKMPLLDSAGKIIGTFGISRNITESKHMQEAIEKRILALTQPMAKGDSVSFEELFDLEVIQRVQNQFSEVTGVASIITKPDGTPITKPSRFTYFCTELVRCTEKGRENCMRSDAELGKPNHHGPIIRECLSSGLWDAGTSIVIGDKHVANWLIGQVRNEAQTEDGMRAYAKEIGADEAALIQAFYQVPAMSKERFGVIAQALHALASTLSNSAYQNLQQARFISERKKAEETLKNNEKQLKELNATKDRFFSIIAHDLKSPFNSIMGFSDLLEYHLDLGEVNKAKDYCHVVKQSAENTMELLNNLLDWARSQTGRLDFDPKVLDLNALANETMEIFKHPATEKDIRLLLDLPESANLYADKWMIATVLRNLVSNAIKFTPKGGAISITIQELLNDWLVSVSDNGVGMPSEVKEKLFRIDQTVTTLGTQGEQGTGLGLILCKEFIEKHGGMIAVDSEPGKGSTFHFNLPKQKSQE